MTSENSDKAKARPVRLTKAMLDLGANYRKDVVLENYGYPVVVTIRPLTEDELEDINARTIKPMDAMHVVKTLGIPITELKKITPEKWSEVVVKAIEEGKIDPEDFKAKIIRYEEIIRVAVIDKDVRENPELLRFGLKMALGMEIERISAVAPEEIESFLRQTAEQELPCSVSPDTSSVEAELRV